MAPSPQSNLPTVSVNEFQSQLANVNANKQPQMVIASSVFIALSTIAVILRIWSRRIQALRLGWDDYLIVLSLVRGLTMNTES